MLTPELDAGAGKRPYAARLPGPERREQLLNAALSVALERGFHAVTVEGVARAAGVTRPVVYGLFADRGALLAGLADRSEDRALAQLAAVLPDVPADLDLDPDALLVQGLTAYLTAIRDDPDNWRVILLPPEGAPVQMQQRITRHRRLVLDRLRELCAWGLARRGGPALDVDLFARSVLTLAEGAARMLLVDPDRWSVDAFTDFARTVLAGLGPGLREDR
ncbi:MAG: hypothetical protein JWN57_2403 [Frankiales bacterium]|jgi:AcrR family transcriptional regulator|nr:hypothetical protein [Frankiales bacterium]